MSQKLPTLHDAAFAGDISFSVHLFSGFATMRLIINGTDMVSKSCHIVTERRQGTSSIERNLTEFPYTAVAGHTEF